MNLGEFRAQTADLPDTTPIVGYWDARYWPSGVEIEVFVANAESHFIEEFAGQTVVAIDVT
jgi:hypothetical protein